MQSIDPGHQGPTTLNGVTPVKILDAPATGERSQAVAIRVTNLDTSALGVILQRDISGTKTEVDRVPIIPAGVTDSSLAARDRPIHLVLDTHSLYMRTVATPAANQPTVEITFLGSVDAA